MCGPSGLRTRAALGDTLSSLVTFGLTVMFFAAFPGAFSAAIVAVKVVFAGIVVVPLLHSFQVKVPSVCPLTGLVAVLLVMPVSGTKVTTCEGEHDWAAAG